MDTFDRMTQLRLRADLSRLRLEVMQLRAELEAMKQELYRSIPHADHERQAAPG